MAGPSGSPRTHRLLENADAETRAGTKWGKEFRFLFIVNIPFPFNNAVSVPVHTDSVLPDHLIILQQELFMNTLGYSRPGKSNDRFIMNYEQTLRSGLQIYNAEQLLVEISLAEWASSLSDAGSFRSLSIKAVLLLYTFIPYQSIYTFSGFLPEQDAADGVHDLFGNETVDDQENKVDPDHAVDLDFFPDDLKDLDQDAVIEVEGVAVVRNERSPCSQTEPG